MTGLGQGPVNGAPLVVQWNVIVTAVWYQRYFEAGCGLVTVAVIVGSCRLVDPLDPVKSLSPEYTAATCCVFPAGILSARVAAPSVTGAVPTACPSTLKLTVPDGDPAPGETGAITAEIALAVTLTVVAVLACTTRSGPDPVAVPYVADPE